MITIRRMSSCEIHRIREVDRSEHVTRAYVLENGALELKEVDWQVPPWLTDGHRDHSLQAKTSEWKPILDSGGVMLGAFDADRLVGFVIYRPTLTEDKAQLAVLHVSNGYRGRGIGTALAREVTCLATARGAKRLYVSAAPTKSTVDFYRSQGFHLAEEVNQELYDREPEDIHMIKEL